MSDWPFKKASHVERLHEFVIKNYCQLASGNFPSFPGPGPGSGTGVGLKTEGGGGGAGPGRGRLQI